MKAAWCERQASPHEVLVVGDIPQATVFGMESGRAQGAGGCSVYQLKGRMERR